MLKGVGQFVAAILAVLVPWIFIAGLGYYLSPKIETYWTEREKAYALVPELQATIAQDRVDLQKSHDHCASIAVRARRNAALIGKFSSPTPPGQPGGLAATDIEELLK